MQVEAIYDQGRLEFALPIRLKYSRVRILVTLKDSDFDFAENPFNSPPEILEAARTTSARFEAILKAPLPPADAMSEMSLKHLELITAFGLRDEIRSLR